MNKPLQCIIVDDEPKAIALLADIIRRIPELHLAGSYTDPFEAMVRIPLVKPELVFLDVEMPGKNGIELTREIQACGLDTHIVFTTGYDQYAIKAIKNGAFDYLLKPIDYHEVLSLVARLSTETDKTIPFAGSPSKQKVKFNTQNGFFIIDLSHIVYILADGNYSVLYMISGEQRIVTVKIGEIEEMKISEQFIRIGRSHIINLEYLSQVDRKKGTCLLSINGFSYTIPINRQGIKVLTKIYEWS